MFNFRFAADREFKEKFERLAEVLGVENPLQHMAEIMDRALAIALDKKDLKRKRARRLLRKSRGSDKSCPGKIPAKSRYTPQRIASTSTTGQGIGANTGFRMGPGVEREQGFKSSTCGPMRWKGATTRGIYGFTAGLTIG